MISFYTHKFPRNISAYRTITFLAIVALMTLLGTQYVVTRYKSPTERGELVVATDLDVPGYFSFGNEMFGYQYDLLSAYAEFLGADLKVVSGNTPKAYQSMLSENKLDVVSTIKSHITDTTNIAIPVYKTSYVVLTGRKNARTLSGEHDIHKTLSGSKVLISHGFSAAKAYDVMLDSVGAAETFLSSRNCFELFESLSNGAVDYLICERSEAELGCALVRNIRQVYEFEEEIPVYVVFGGENKELARSFRSWMQSFVHTEEYAELNSMYFDKGVAGQILARGIGDKKKGAISVFDDVFKTVCRQEGMDWRMAAAIAYNESKFNPYIVSPRGARGMMQIMPSVARQFDVDVDSVMKIEHNIRLALRVLKKIEASLKMAPGTDFENRMSIILACYNGGIGHVLDARRLAAKYGGNPDSWDDVSHYLKRKADATFLNDEVVKSGRFKGSGETLAFVSNVINKYHSYCSRASL